MQILTSFSAGQSVDCDKRSWQKSYLVKINWGHTVLHEVNQVRSQNADFDVTAHMVTQRLQSLTAGMLAFNLSMMAMKAPACSMNRKRCLVLPDLLHPNGLPVPVALETLDEQPGLKAQLINAMEAHSQSEPDRVDWLIWWSGKNDQK